MSAVKDARVATTLPSHPKTKKLMRLLGERGAWYLIRVFLWATENRSDGDLTGIADDDIELAIDWPGEPLQFVQALVVVGYIEGPVGQRRIHDWADHNPWAAGAEQRTVKARWNAAKRHHGEAEADRQVPAYRCGAPATSNANSDADSTDAAVLETKSSSAPLPSPSPSPLPISSSGDSIIESEVKAKDDRIPYQAIVDLYNRTMVALPKVRVINPARRQLIKRAFAEPKWRSLTFWESFFAECQDDPWLNGTGPYNSGWEPNFDHLLSTKVLTRIYERGMDRIERAA